MVSKVLSILSEVPTDKGDKDAFRIAYSCYASGLPRGVLRI